MRTTLDIDSDVLAAAKALAQSGHSTAGRVITDAMRRAIALGLAHSNSPAVAHKMPMARPLPPGSVDNFYTRTDRYF